MKSTIHTEKPTAANPHVWFDGEAVASDKLEIGSMHSNISRRQFLLGAGAVLATPALAAESKSGVIGSDVVNRFEFGDDGTFTFLMVSDWHRRTGKSDTAREIAVFRKAVARFRTSLVVFGGDNVSGGTGCNKRGVFEELMTPVMAEFKASGTSLCVAFGNHDSEQPESNREFVSRQEQYDWYKASLGGLFVDHDLPTLRGREGSVPLSLPLSLCGK